MHFLTFFLTTLPLAPVLAYPNAIATDSPVPVTVQPSYAALTPMIVPNLIGKPRSVAQPTVTTLSHGEVFELVQLPLPPECSECDIALEKCVDATTVINYPWFPSTVCGTEICKSGPPQCRLDGVCRGYRFKSDFNMCNFFASKPVVPRPSSRASSSMSTPPPNSATSTSTSASTPPPSTVTSKHLTSKRVTSRYVKTKTRRRHEARASMTWFDGKVYDAIDEPLPAECAECDDYYDWCYSSGPEVHGVYGDRIWSGGFSGTRVLDACSRLTCHSGPPQCHLYGACQGYGIEKNFNYCNTWIGRPRIPDFIYSAAPTTSA